MELKVGKLYQLCHNFDAKDETSKRKRLFLKKGDVILLKDFMILNSPITNSNLYKIIFLFGKEMCFTSFFDPNYFLEEIS